MGTVRGRFRGGGARSWCGAAGGSAASEHGRADHGSRGDPGSVGCGGAGSASPSRPGGASHAGVAPGGLMAAPDASGRIPQLLARLGFHDIARAQAALAGWWAVDAGRAVSDAAGAVV